MTFQLDTTGIVAGPFNITGYLCWDDLDAFTQGYVEAMFASADHPGFLDVEPGNDDAGHKRVGFSDLVPEALARIIADCAVSATEPTTGEPRGEGAAFWRLRNACDYVGFPPLTVQLGDDSKVRFA